MSIRLEGEQLDGLFLRVNRLSGRSGIQQLVGPKFSSRRAEFSMSLCLVALGVRAGYLVDTFSPAEGERDFQRLLMNLRQESTLFGDVFLLCVSDFKQFLFLNAHLLRAHMRLKASRFPSGHHQDLDLSFIDRTAFVFLGPEITLISPPTEVISLAEYIVKSTSDPVSLPGNPTAATMIPLVGFLLEYAVAYVPVSAEQTEFLNGVPLDVYECILIADQQCAGGTPREHTLLKFSCPAHLSGLRDSLEPGIIAKRLEKLFRGRLDKVGCDWPLRVTHAVVTQDRVAM